MWPVLQLPSLKEKISEKGRRVEEHASRRVRPRRVEDHNLPQTIPVRARTFKTSTAKKLFEGY